MAEHRYRLRGAVDISVADKIRTDLKLIVLATDAHVLVDCAELEFIDSTGIAVLLEAHRDFEELGRHMLLVNMPPEPRQILEFHGVTDLCRYDRRTESLAAVRHIYN